MNSQNLIWLFPNSLEISLYHTIIWITKIQLLTQTLQAEAKIFFLHTNLIIDAINLNSSQKISWLSSSSKQMLKDLTQAKFCSNTASLRSKQLNTISFKTRSLSCYNSF